MGRYPTEDEGLIALVNPPDSEDAEKWKGPYVKRLNKDPWGNAYVYLYPGYYNTESFDILSYGADGTEEGEGFNADIGNWNVEDEELEE